MRYTFGNSEAAAKRLETIAEFFNPSAMEFIADHVHEPVATGLDLGCGPGYSTEMLRRTLYGAKVYGVDNSAAFLELAKKNFPLCHFIKHDVRKRPLPVLANIMYERFLLSHLAKPVELLQGWLMELMPAGLLFVDELEEIDTDVHVFQNYLQINTGLIQSQGADLFVGKTLTEGKYKDAQILYNDPVRLPVKNSLAAKWFLPNSITIWEKEKYVLSQTTARQRNEISSELEQIIESEDCREDIVWTMRRIVFKRC